MSNIKVTQITPGYKIGEGPHWIERDQSLIYVDIPNANIYRYFTDSKRIQSLHIEDGGTGQTVSFIVPIEKSVDSFAIGVGRTVCTVQWSPDEPDSQTKKPVHLMSVDDEIVSTRFNDGKCDPSGRLWAGTTDNAYGIDIELHKGSLFMFDDQNKVSKMAEKISLSNGLVWSNDQKTFYYIDSSEIKIDAFDYDPPTGKLDKKRTVLDFKSPPEILGFPDGMTIDENGNLWVACFGSGQVICVDPKVGKVISKVSVPSPNTTSCCWGGPDYSTLFVTSAKIILTEEDLKRIPDAGKTFAVTGLGTKGKPQNEFKLDKKYWKTS